MIGTIFQKRLPQNIGKELKSQPKLKNASSKETKRHLHQAHGTPCTVDPLASLLGYNSFTHFGNKVLDGSVNLTNKNLVPLQQLREY